MSEHILDKVFEIIKQRKGAEASASYVAKLYGEGTARIAQKFGEEAVETVIEAMKLDAGKDATFADEAADTIFHLLVLCAHLNIEPENIWSVLEKRAAPRDQGKPS